MKKRKTQYRRTVSMRPETYARLAMLADLAGASMSETVEQLIATGCDLHSVPEVDREDARAMVRQHRKMLTEDRVAAVMNEFFPANGPLFF